MDKIVQALALPTEHTPVTKYGIPSITVGIPWGLVGLAVGVFYVGHVTSQLFHVMPIVASFLGCFITLIWLISLGERAIFAKRLGIIDEPAHAAIAISAIMASILFFVFMICSYNTWQGYSSPPSPPPNCKQDGGVKNTIKLTYRNSYGEKEIVRIECRSGYGFNQD